jgi:outer membrane receptor protein involved in Fe transport
LSHYYTTIALLAGTAAPALAQQTADEKAKNPPEALTNEAAIESGTKVTPTPAAAANPAIVITGSRIKRPNLESVVPITSLGGEEFFETGRTSVGDTINELPQAASTFSQSNSTRFLGTEGLNLLDLRGLGTVRTLVLVNGRRHVGGDVLSSGVSVDINTIPTDLIERVDVVTGGNSAVYGSDAIAGVVNFILKDNYDGIMLRGQGGQSKYGDADSYFVSALIGRNFASGRGNVAVNLEYSRRDQAWGYKRTEFRENYTQSNGSPYDFIENLDFRSASFNNTGNIRFGGPGTSLNCGLDPSGNPYNCPFIFMPNGDLVPQTGTRQGIGPNGQFVGGNGRCIEN